MPLKSFLLRLPLALALSAAVSLGLIYVSVLQVSPSIVLAMNFSD